AIRSAASVPVSRIARTVAATPESEIEIRSTFGSAGVQLPPRVRSYANADGSRGSTQELTAFQNGSADSEFAFAQNFAAARRQARETGAISAADAIAARNARLNEELD